MVIEYNFVVLSILLLKKSINFYCSAYRCVLWHSIVITFLTQNINCDFLSYKNCDFMSHDFLSVYSFRQGYFYVHEWKCQPWSYYTNVVYQIFGPFKK